MAICQYCGTQSPDSYTQCPKCGAGLMQQQGTPSPMYGGGYAVPPAPVQEPPTTVGGWFGWYLLCYVLPLIGTIIMLCTVKDPSAKNYAKVMLIMQIISLILVIACIGFIVALLRNIVVY